MEHIALPNELTTVIGSESPDFTVKAGRANPLKHSLFFLLFGIVWSTMSSVFAVALLSPLLHGKEVHFTVNGVPTVAGPDNLNPIIAPGIVICLFILIGIALLAWSVYSMFKKGGFFVGTPTRLIQYQSGTIRSIDWEQFSGDIEIGGTAQRGNISLQLRTGQMVRQKHGPDRYVPDTIHLVDIPNAFEIEQVCRKRIKENDPTPSLSEHKAV